MIIAVVFLKIFLLYLYCITPVGCKNNDTGDGNNDGNNNCDNDIDNIKKTIQTIRQCCKMYGP